LPDPVTLAQAHLAAVQAASGDVLTHRAWKHRIPFCLQLLKPFFRDQQQRLVRASVKLRVGDLIAFDAEPMNLSLGDWILR